MRSASDLLYAFGHKVIDSDKGILGHIHCHIHHHHHYHLAVAVFNGMPGSDSVAHTRDGNRMDE